MQLIWAAKQIKGGRDYQEDFYGIFSGNQFQLVDKQVKTKVSLPSNGTLFVMTDGMGGMGHGDEAAKLINEEFVYFFANKAATAGPTVSLLEKSLAYANNQLGKYVEKHPQKQGMGCTIIAVYVNAISGDMVWLSVGDSPLYRLNGSKIQQINQVHTWGNHAEAIFAQQKEKDPTLTLDYLKNLRNPDHLVSAVSGGDIQLIDKQQDSVDPGDVIIIASDGLETLSLDEIKNTLKYDAFSPKEAKQKISNSVQALMDRVTFHMGTNPRQDNTTAIVFTLLDEAGGPVKLIQDTLMSGLSKYKSETTSKSKLLTIIAALLLVFVAGLLLAQQEVRDTIFGNDSPSQRDTPNGNPQPIVEKENPVTTASEPVVLTANQSWEKVKKAQDPSMLSAFLTKYSDSEYAEEARALLEEYNENSTLMNKFVGLAERLDSSLELGADHKRWLRKDSELLSAIERLALERYNFVFTEFTQSQLEEIQEQVDDEEAQLTNIQKDENMKRNAQNSLDRLKKETVKLKSNSTSSFVVVKEHIKKLDKFINDENNAFLTQEATEVKKQFENDMYKGFYANAFDNAVKEVESNIGAMISPDTPIDEILAPLNKFEETWDTSQFAPYWVKASFNRAKTKARNDYNYKLNELREIKNAKLAKLEVAYEQAKNKHTIEAYEAFLNKSARSEYKSLDVIAQLITKANEEKSTLEHIEKERIEEAQKEELWIRFEKWNGFKAGAPVTLYIDFIVDDKDILTVDFQVDTYKKKLVKTIVLPVKPDDQIYVRMRFDDNEVGRKAQQFYNIGKKIKLDIDNDYGFNLRRR
jgi:serine/threonine protein phosphatase PrpC